MKGKKRQSADSIINARTFFRSGILSVAVTILLMLVFSLISYKLDNPGAYVKPFAYAALAISALMTGFISSRMQGRSHLISGLVGGFITVIFMFLLSLFFRGGEGVSALASLGIYALYILISGIGGILGGVKRVKTRRRRR